MVDGHHRTLSVMFWVGFAICQIIWNLLASLSQMLFVGGVGILFAKEIQCARKICGNSFGSLILLLGKAEW